MGEKKIQTVHIPKELSRKKQKYQVLLEDGDCLFLCQEEVLRFGITEGKVYTLGQWEDLLQQIQLQRAYQKGLDLLLFRKNSRWELIEKLKGNDFSQEVAEAAADRLEEAGYLNDMQYAQSYVRKHMEDAYTTAEQIKQTLLKKGISHDIIETVFSAYAPETEEEEAEKLKRFIKKKYSKLIQAGEIDYNKKISIQNALYRKGYAPALIQKVVNEIWG